MVCKDTTMFGRDTTRLFENLKSEGAKKSTYWEIAFKFVQIKSLANAYY